MCLLNWTIFAAAADILKLTYVNSPERPQDRCLPLYSCSVSPATWWLLVQKTVIRFIITMQTVIKLK